MIKIITRSPDETKELGYKIGKLLKAGDVLCLDGDLGAGKTTLTQAITKGLDVEDYVTSPTFTIVNEYEGRFHINHFDVYRIADVDEMYDIGYEEYVYSDSVSIIEWASIIEEILPEDRIDLYINKLQENNNREIEIKIIGKGNEDIIKGLNRE
ncbi:tRNA (adenosine(37)-N6)-threonylcarbamoyltransferase complex ATPase subunit type 1 TsaE [Clostridium sp. D2Q-14]|uniref:tRNA (adenosine(37)-N6)-threonylcarbamoyltransferase complex ATPase subunit type 1 TsaE n=1 Tax=Anaeromonas gelatinilytica TaxID=2683194 RepID=UPI00193B621F|nr:tRNA (adenosine(37)-N6)-threonylcarbamoyltransferase complex ATPase subunit type 1 TsaE [Anaeromonas gelatinilytica]MBS4534639.1 tRNA (adenosine(37)-N6)-threonylcarbamoyltransferase complex ATPase subunit type 1 TsaE [Anaeromonas gelatinilytica]